MNQPMAIDPESVGAVERLIGSAEVVEEGHTVSIHEVRAHAFVPIYTTHIMDFSGARYPNQQLTGCRWELHLSFSVNVIGVAALSRTRLETIDTAYRQTLSAFNTFVCRITNVCLLNRRYQVLTDNMQRSTRTLRWRSVRCTKSPRYLLIMLNALA